MIRIAICDDELEARENLRFQLEKIINEKQEEIVYEFSGGGSAAIRAKSTSSFWMWKCRI